MGLSEQDHNTVTYNQAEYTLNAKQGMSATYIQLRIQATMLVQFTDHLQ